MLQKTWKQAVLSILLCLCVSPAGVFSADTQLNYDPYQPVWRYPDAHDQQTAERKDRTQTVMHLLEQPFRPIGYGISQSLEWVERKRLDKKAAWFVDELAKRGIHPEFRTASDAGFGAIGAGGHVDFEDLLKIDQPVVRLRGFGGIAPNHGYDGTSSSAGIRYHVNVPSRQEIYHQGILSYDHSSSENFYGIGQDTSLGNWSTFSYDELTLEGKAGMQVAYLTELIGSISLRNIQVGSGNRERVGKMKQIFSPATVPGINGADILTLTMKLDHDTRDHESDPKRGGYQEFLFSYNNDVDGSEFQYLKIKATAAQFVPLWSDRRILALRLTAEKNQELGNGAIPFFDMARLGGGKRTQGSELLRSHRFNRFFEEGLVLANAEYRYSIWEYGDFGADAVALFDIGEVFEELGDFEFDELRVAAGGGVNLKFRRNVFLSFIVATGQEGIDATTSTRVSF